MKNTFSFVALFMIGLFAIVSNGDDESAETNFSINGDFSSAMEMDFTSATIVVNITSQTEDGTLQREELASAELVDGKFELKGFVESAIIADISVTIPGQDRASFGRAIIEPGGDLTLDYFGPYHELHATGDGLHAELISSWASDPDYLDASIAYGFYMESLFARMDKRQAEMEAKESEEVTEAEAETETETATATHDAITEEREPSEHAEVLDWASMECADYTVDFVSVLDRVYDDSEYPLLTQSIRRMNDIMTEKRNSVLNEIAIEADDPMKQLIAMELGAFGGMSQQSEALNAWRQLATSLDEETVAVRVQPTIDRMERSVRIRENDEYLVPGVFAPTFTLPNFEGTEVTLASVLEENEVVMIDFWASWCGPCIAQFPHLKQLYAEYASKGFEIVGISVDSTHEAWSGALEEHEPPWIQLGEINADGWGQISQEYGVRFIPHTYVLDDESCIMKKDLQPDELEDFLEARLDS